MTDLIPDDEPYRPNKYTRHIPADAWRAFTCGATNVLPVIDPGYVNEPGETLRKAQDWEALERWRDEATSEDHAIEVVAPTMLMLVIIGFGLYVLARYVVGQP